MIRKYIVTLLLLANSVLFGVSQPRILEGNYAVMFTYHTSLDCTDTIIIDRKVYVMAVDPLYLFNTYKSKFEVSDKIHPELQDFSYIQPFHTTRFYRSTWCIRRGRLYLCHVEPDFQNSVHIPTEVGFELAKKGIPDAQYWANILPPKDSIKRRIELLTGRKFKNKLMFADWFSGMLNIGESIRPGSISERWKLNVKIVLTIEKGVVVKREDLDKKHKY